MQSSSGGTDGARKLHAPREKAMAKFLYIGLFIFCVSHLCADVISIGNGNILHQGLPIEPVARFSYTQQLYYASEIGMPGEITQLEFHYNVQSEGFYQGNKEWKIYLGHSALQELDAWQPISGLSLVYDGVLSYNYFTSGLPGVGWLSIPLQESFQYNGSDNLILAVDENTDGQGSTSDDFFCSQTGYVRGLNFQSMSVNPDPGDPPATFNTKYYISNLRLHMGSAVNPDAPQNLYGNYYDQAIRLFWEAPQSGEPSSYLLHRDGLVIHEPVGLNYVDSDIHPGNTYTYSVQAAYASGDISPHSNHVQITVPESGQDMILYQGFEELTPFSSVIPGYQNLDLDGSQTWGWEHLDFPGEGSAMAWMTFAPGATTPPATDIAAATGGKMLMAASAVTPPNNDWLILPNLRVGTSASFSFKARSYTAAYGLERLRVMISTTDADPQSFTPLHTEPWLGIPAAWTDYSFELASYANQDIYLALNCVSLDAFALFIDDLMVIADSGHVGLDCPVAAVPKPFPNPSGKDFKVSSDAPFDLSIYNLRGQKLGSAKGVRSYEAINLGLSSGIYFVRISQAGRHHTFRQVVVP